MAQTETNIACVERLEIPAYPPLAMQARIAGVFTASMRIGADGSIGNISSQFVPESTKSVMFVSAVEESLRASVFAKSCAGKQVSLVFNFVIAEPGASTQLKFSFGYPNQFWIVAHFRTYVD
jgi:outer membrane biosynthesis protein TonB